MISNQSLGFHGFLCVYLFSIFLSISGVKDPDLLALQSSIVLRESLSIVKSNRGKQAVDLP